MEGLSGRHCSSSCYLVSGRFGDTPKSHSTQPGPVLAKIWVQIACWLLLPVLWILSSHHQLQTPIGISLPLKLLTQSKHIGERGIHKKMKRERMLGTSWHALISTSSTDPAVGWMWSQLDERAGGRDLGVHTMPAGVYFLQLGLLSWVLLGAAMPWGLRGKTHQNKVQSRCSSLKVLFIDS